MLKFLIASILSVSLCSPAFAEAKEEALQVLNKWMKAFTESDVDGIIKLYASDAIFFGTSSKKLLTHRDEIRKYFERALLNDRPRRATTDEHSVVVL